MTDQVRLAARSLDALVWAYSGAFVRILAQLAIQVTLARILGPNAFGQATMVLIVLGMGWLLADGGFGSALIQKAELVDDDISYALGWVLLLSILIGAIVFFSAPILARALNDSDFIPLMRACAFLVPLQALSNIPTSLLRRNLDMKRQQLLNVGSYVIGMGGVGIPLAVAGYGAWSLIVGFGVQTLLLLVVGYLLAKFPLRVVLSGNSALRSFGIGAMATNIANWAIDNLDRVVVGRVWGATSLGEYSAAGSLSRAPASLLVGAAQSVVFASASRVQDDGARVARGFTAATCLILLTTCPLFSFLAMHAAIVVDLLYGQAWQNAGPLFSALCISIPSYALLSVAGPTLWAVGAAKSEFKVQIVIAALLVFGLVALARFPLEAAVWWVPTLYAARSVFVVMALSRRIDITARRVGRAAVGGILLTCVVMIISMAAAKLSLQPICRALVAAFGSTLLGVAMLRVTARWILVPELRSMLLARCDGSILARWVSRMLGFTHGR